MRSAVPTIILLVAGFAAAQTAGWVATIKPATPGEPAGFRFVSGGHRVESANAALVGLMAFAWDLHRSQVVGGPSWLYTDRYDLDAQLDGDARRNGTEWQAALREILTDRLRLTVHREMRDLSVYAFTAGKAAPKLTANGDPKTPPSFGFSGRGNLTMNNASMDYFVGVIQRYVLDRPVLERTGITGVHNFTLRWRPDEFQFVNMPNQEPIPSATEDDRPDLATAVQQQLGIRLESTKARMEVLVIDRAEKPSEN